MSTTVTYTDFNDCGCCGPCPCNLTSREFIEITLSDFVDYNSSTSPVSAGDPVRPHSAINGTHKMGMTFANTWQADTIFAANNWNADITVSCTGDFEVEVLIDWSNSGSGVVDVDIFDAFVSFGEPGVDCSPLSITHSDYTHLTRPNHSSSFTNLGDPGVTSEITDV